MLKKLFVFLLVVGVLVASAGAGGLYWLVAVNPGSEIDSENIKKILGQESPVFYRDGQTRLGVFFDQAHRQYVSFEQIPENFVNALVASEDSRFFSHFGFDVQGIIRAAMKNYQAGRVVQGGSTLTQQTAKNLFKRNARSYQAKLKELLFALRLEYRYPKEKIFEFYANQFYVSGNGHGLGVAARYYFNKSVEQLNLLECAFIAGSVKRPNYYNPFIKSSKEGDETARKRAATRVGYVLDKMRQQGMITEVQYSEAIAEEVKFNKGTMGFALDYVMEMVRDAVSTREVSDALKARGIENVATAGLKVITTVDERLQKKTLFSLRRELSRLDVLLRGYVRQEVQDELEAVAYKGDRKIEKNAFLFGKIIAIEGGSKDSPLQIHVFFGPKRPAAIITDKGIERLLTSWVKWKKNRWAKVAAKDKGLFLKEMAVGDKVWVSVNEISDNGLVELELQRFPLIKGGALVLKDGLIRAMAGGVENRFFNRAVYAKRTMGSAFKPFLYSAALQLGWGSEELLRNERDVFVFQGQPYFPRPDHRNENKKVSMSWAGVRSENLASVWLLYHLLDHLDSQKFLDLCKRLRLSPQFVDGEEEPYRTFRARIRDRYGIVINRKKLKEAAYDSAIRNLRTDFMFDNRLEEYDFFSGLHYGQDFDKFKEEINLELRKKGLSDSQVRELWLRKKLLKNTYISLVALQVEFQLFQSDFGDPWKVFGPAGSNIQGRNADLYWDPVNQWYSFVDNRHSVENLERVDRAKLQEFLFRIHPDEQKKFWADVRLNSLVTNGAVQLVASQVDRELQRLECLPPYSMEVLSSVRDFRVMAGLNYLIEFGKEAGIRSRLEPVLSFPLGSNVVSLLETTRLYQTLVTGQVDLSGDDRQNQDLLCIIDRIESEDGTVLYTPKRRINSLVDAETRMQLGHVLENVVKFGTGRYADKNVRLGTSESEEVKGSELAGLDFSIPLLGKTGTANRYTNASFFGYLPGLAPRGDGMIIKGGTSVGVYVGYDDNKPMRHKATRITGSGGALPTWCSLVEGVLDMEGYRQKLDPVDLSFYGLTLRRQSLGQTNLKVSAPLGGRTISPIETVDEKSRYQPSIMTFGTVRSDGTFSPKRRFAPFWGSSDHLAEKDL
ncbi:MAG: transglycosylase domain-containing protein [Thermodesulfobacteriota bacterium]